MENQDIISFIVQAFLFWIAYKIGTLHGSVRAMQELKTHTTAIRHASILKQQPVITVEEINGIYYAYEGNDFLAQGKSPDELGKLIANRFPNRYHAAKIEMRG